MLAGTMALLLPIALLGQVVSAPEERAAVIVRPAGAQPDRLAEIRKDLGAAFAGASFFGAWDEADPAQGQAVAASCGEAIREAEQAYRRFEHAQALQSLARCRQAASGARACMPAGLLEGLEALEARVRFATGDRPGALRAFARLLVLSPDWEPAAGVLAPKMRAVLDEARAELRASRPAGLSVEALPARAEGLVDGRPLGSGRLSAGVHCAEIRLAGRPGGLARLALGPSESRGERVWALPEACRALRGAASRPEPQALRAAGEDGADWLLLVDVGPRALSARVYDLQPPGRGQVSGEIHCRQDKADCLRGGIADALGSLRAQRVELLAALRQAARPGTEAPAEPAWYERWWVWTLAGCMLAGAAAGLAAGLCGGDGERGYEGVVTLPRR
ncbi:MAG: hypothetical protein JXR96_28920 [Deltaproteobacteria bacterium]|nr:hypothetical protein [Deltaproteobacteria bacterium]